MSDTALHRRVALAALVALAGVAGVVAGAPATADDVPNSDYPAVSNGETEVSVAQTDATNESENVTASFVNDGERLEFHPARNQNVTVRTNADPGTELNVVLLEDGTYSNTYEMTVSEDGTATASLDLRNVEPGTNLTVRVANEQGRLATATGVVSAYEVTFVHDGERLVLETAENQTVRVRSDAAPGTKFTVELQAHGAFLKTRDVVIQDDGTATATFDFSDVESGTEFDASVRQSSDTAVEGLILNESAAAPTTANESGFASTTNTTTATTDGSSGSSVPGFGVPVALVALLAGLALARRD